MAEDTTLNQSAIGAVVGGYLGAPFDVLGPHLIDGNLVIRTFNARARGSRHHG